VKTRPCAALRLILAPLLNNRAEKAVTSQCYLGKAQPGGRNAGCKQAHWLRSYPRRSKSARFLRGQTRLPLRQRRPVRPGNESRRTAIRIAKAKDFTPAPYTVMGWEVSDIEAVVKWLTQRGVAFEKYPFVQDRELGIWTTPGGGKVAWFKDPDGNVLSVSQHK